MAFGKYAYTFFFALIGFCDWIETDFSAGHLRRLLQSGDLGIQEEDEGFRAGPDDADTTGAIYGQLAGAFYGVEAIPGEWRGKLAARETLEAFASRLVMRG